MKRDPYTNLPPDGSERRTPWSDPDQKKGKLTSARLIAIVVLALFVIMMLYSIR